MRPNRRNDVRVHFEPAVKVKLMAIDGTWCRDCLLVDVSDTGARLSIDGFGAAIEEFFLMLSSIGPPSFRRCKRAWINGDQIGVRFEKRQVASKLHERSPRRDWASTPT